MSNRDLAFYNAKRDIVIKLLYYLDTKKQPRGKYKIYYDKLHEHYKTRRQMERNLIRHIKSLDRIIKKLSRTDQFLIDLLNPNIVSAKSFLKDPQEYGANNNYTYDKNHTELGRINNNPILFQAKIKELLDSGREEIKTKRQLSEFPLGSLVSYVTKDGLYRSGGFLRTIQDKYFALQGGNSTNPISFSVQFDNIAKMYVGSPVKLANRTDKKTNFEVKIGNKVVYYAKSNYDAKRFKSTQKYKRMLNYDKEKNKRIKNEKEVKKLVKKMNTSKRQKRK